MREKGKWVPATITRAEWRQGNKFIYHFTRKDYLGDDKDGYRVTEKYPSEEIRPIGFK